MNRRIVAGMLFTTVVCMTLGGCGFTADKENVKNSGAVESVMPGAEVSTEMTERDAEADNGVVQLKVWSEEDNFDMLNQMIDSFKQKYAGEAKFEITLEQNADSDTKDVLLGDIHNGADVFSFADDQLSAMVAAGALYPVPNAEEVKSANLEESVSAASINDILYAYPMTADNGYFLYYDKNVLSDEDVQTMDGMLEALNAAGKSFSMEFNSGWYLYTFFGNTGLEFGINDDGVTNYCNWNSTDGAIKGIDVAQAILNITTNPAFISQPDGDFVSGVQNGTIGAGISGVWNAVSIKEAWGDNYGAVKLPTYTVAGQQVQMSSFTGYKMMGVNYYSEHKEWACKLADWLTNEENQTIRFQQRSQGPSNINAAASDEIGKDPAIAAVIDQGQYGNLQRVGNSYWDACTDFANTILNGNPEGKDWQVIMDTLVNKITASAVG